MIYKKPYQQHCVGLQNFLIKFPAGSTPNFFEFKLLKKQATGFTFQWLEAFS